MQHLIYVYNLLNRIRRSGLLPIPECGIRYIDFLRHINRHMTVVVSNLGNHIIGENLSEQFRGFHVLQAVYVLVFLQ